MRQNLNSEVGLILGVFAVVLHVFLVHITKTKDNIIFTKTIEYAPKDVIQRQRKNKFFRLQGHEKSRQ
jgi:hypothetical protein